MVEMLENDIIEVTSSDRVLHIVMVKEDPSLQDVCGLSLA